jgi:putative membrane protein
MERRLVVAIMTPAAIVTWVLGVTMAVLSGVYEETWFQIKLILVVGMTVCHFYLVHYKNLFAADQNVKSSKFFRILNEVPTLLMIGIVILVITKPI